MENKETHLGGDPNVSDISESHQGEFTRITRTQFIAPNGFFDDSFVLILVQNQVFPFSKTVQSKHDFAQKQDNQEIHIARQMAEYSNEDYCRHWKM